MTDKALKSIKPTKSGIEGKGGSVEQHEFLNRIAELERELKSTKRELKSANNQLISSQCDFKSIKYELNYLLDKYTNAVRIINKDFTIRYINQAFTEMTGADQNAVAGKKCWEVFPSSLCHTSDCRLQRILNGGKVILADIERQKHDGTTIPCMVATSPLLDDAGKLIGIIEQFQDITERRLMEEQVKESEDRYRSMIELGTEIGEAVVMLQDIDGKEGIQTFVSDQWPRITGYTKEELVGKCFFDLLDIKDRDASIARHRQKVSGIPIPGLFEMRIVRKNGSKVTIELTGACTKYQGRPANVLYIRDISQHKQIENELASERDRFLTLFQNVPISLWEMDYSKVKKYIDCLKSQGVTNLSEYFDKNPQELRDLIGMERVIGLNNATLVLYEAETLEELITTSVDKKFASKPNGVETADDATLSHIGNSSYLSNPLNLEAYNNFYNHISEGLTHFGYDGQIITLKNHLKYFHIDCAVAPGYEHNLSRVFTSLYDITARKQLENRLHEHQQHLEELVNNRTTNLKREIELRKQTEEQLEGLVAVEKSLRLELETQMKHRIELNRMLVHELKTPLVPFLGTSSILMQNLKEEPWHSMAENINRGAIALSRRIDELLDIERDDNGTLQLNIQKLDPALILRQVYDIVASQVKAKEQKLTLELPPSAPFICGDNERLQQVLLNLLNNAFKFTQYGGEITLRARNNPDHVIMEVQDNGIGISEAEQGNLFKQYFHLDGNEEHRSGLGVGLVLCKRLIEKQGGKIWASSNLGQGSTFSFSVPIWVEGGWT